MPAERRCRSSLLPSIDLGKLRGGRLRDYVVRFVFGAAVSVAAGVVGTTVGARFGGLFLAFPAILPASLTLVQEKEGARRADRDAIGAVLGGVGLVVFAATGEATFGRLEPFAALVLASVVWVLASCALYALLAILRPDVCHDGDGDG